MICLLCGNTIDDDDERCPHCGAWVEDADEESMDQSFSEIGFTKDSDYQIVTTVLRAKTGDSVQIAEYPAILGRSSRCDLTISGNPAIGRRHLQVERIGDHIFIRDLDSLNHTYINEEQITSPVELLGGESIRIADELFIFRKEIL